MNPSKITIDGNEYDLFPAEVVDVDFNGLDKEKLYTVKCKLISPLGSQASGDIIQARALDVNIKNIPIIGEVVMVMKAPTAYNSAVKTGQEFYYTNPISIQSSVHHNGLPGLTDFIPNSTPKNQQKRQNVQFGIPNKTSARVSTNKTIDPAFQERTDIYPIQPYPGDLIFEGRWGQSIRMGSTIDVRRKYTNTPLWSGGLGSLGNPILIISNGTNPEIKPSNEFILEDIDKDDSSIWMTSGQRVPFTPASKYLPSIKSKKIDLYRSNDFAGNQLLFASDRIILNARKQEIILFSKEGIGFSTEKSINIDGKSIVEIESEKKISLGINAVSPALLGDRTMDWLNEFCDLFIKTLKSITQITVPTGVGPSGMPINSPAFLNIRGGVESLKSEIEKLQSRLVFLNENSGGPSDDAISSNQQRKQVEENRKNGIEPDRKMITPSDVDLTENGKDIQTGATTQQSVLRNLKDGTYIGNRSVDSKTWMYDKSVTKWLDSPGESSAEFPKE
ncbi:hypothetical protein [Microcystis phage Mel-JY01]